MSTFIDHFIEDDDVIKERGVEAGGHTCIKVGPLSLFTTNPEQLSCLGIAALEAAARLRNAKESA